MNKAVLFDMDGVLIDTERLKEEAHMQTLARFGGTLPPDTYSRVMGRAQHEAQAAFAAAAGVEIGREEYSSVFGERYRLQIEANVPMTKGALELLANLRDHGCRLALVTSSLRWMLDMVLERTPLAPFFDALISADDVTREKPAPDAYLLALERLELSPDDAVVVEDTEAGVAAGLAAGCQVIAIRHGYNHRHDFTNSFAVLPGFDDVSAAANTIISALSQ